MLRLRQEQEETVSAKTKLSTVLHGWLPILQSSLEDLEERVRELAEENPFLEVRSGFELSFSSLEGREAAAGDKIFLDEDEEGRTGFIEKRVSYRPSLYEVLQTQIGPPLFPTEQSVKIAHAIVEMIDEEGYFEGKVRTIARRLGVTPGEVEKVRRRFAWLSPAGVGAVSPGEALLFQLRQSDVREPLYSYVETLLSDMSVMGKHRREPMYEQAMKVIRRMTLPPAIEYLEESSILVPELIVRVREGQVELFLNDAYYPDIHIESPDLQHSYVKKKLKEARDVINALNMRKSTLYKVGLAIVEFQYDFFLGGDIRPMRLKDIADEYEHNPSTISRAIADKYLLCDRGLYPLRFFFIQGIDEEVSITAIKDYMREVIQNEDRDRPLSDIHITDMVNQKFGIKIGRRTIAKYRMQMEIADSRDRKKLYRMA